MKRNLASLLIAIACFVIAVPAQRNPTAETVLQKVAIKLDSLKRVSYTYERELNYASEAYLSKAIATSYLDLTPTDSGAAFRFQSADDEYIAVYNGSESFVAVKSKKIMQVTNNPPLSRLESSSSLYNSPLTLRGVLPKIIADPKIPKKITVETVDGQRRYVVEFSLPKASISGLGDIRELRSDRTSIYTIPIDAKTFLPLGVLVTNNENKDFTKTTFSNFNLKPKPPEETSWYFSSYANDYKLLEEKEKKLLAVGQTPPHFVLNVFERIPQATLSAYQGKVLVVEFWIVHCGFCIAAVPKLNEIAKTFAGQPDFRMLSINISDSPATIAGFRDRHKPDYPILIDGEATGDAYGVGAYPAIFVIGKDGKIAYASSGLFEKELESAIKASLEK